MRDIYLEIVFSNELKCLLGYDHERTHIIMCNIIQYACTHIHFAVFNLDYVFIHFFSSSSSSLVYFYNTFQITWCLYLSLFCFFFVFFCSNERFIVYFGIICIDCSHQREPHIFLLNTLSI